MTRQCTQRIAAVALMGASLLLLSLGTPGRALAWELFRSENPDVREGNDAVDAGDYAGALAAYDRAAAALPREPRVHLDRGIALLGQGEDLDAAREALRRATEAPAPREVRAAAYYNLGLSFYRQGDAAASGEDHQAATRAFREAADAFRQSLRQEPGNRDAGWNLELAVRRIRDEEEAQRQQEEQEEQEQQDGDQEGDQQQDGDQEGDQEQDGDQQQDGDQEGDQEQDGDQDGDQEQESDSQADQEGDEAGEGEDPGAEEADSQEDSSDQSSPEGTEGRDEEAGAEEEPLESTGSEDRSLPPEMERALDALEAGESSLERQRAAARARTDGRRVTRDW